MDKDMMRNIICLIVFLVFGGLTALFMLVNLNLVVVDFSSIKGIIAKREELLELEKKLDSTEAKYTESKKSLSTAQNSFTTAKNKYEAISDETINLIKEATTEENYNIEYMWIRLGNYATSNNLKIVLVEPGGKNTSTVQSTESTSETKDSNTSTDSSSTTTTSTNSDTLMTITLQGSYLNVSDFIFEVENDKELRFKLDNIEMTYVEGTTIKTKFDIKNVIVLK